MRRFTLLELCAMTGVGCLIVLTIALGHIAGWW